MNKATKEQRKIWTKNYKSKNRELLAKKAKEYRKTSETHNQNKRKKLYGISNTQFIEMLTAQNYQCAICYKDLIGKRQHLDHCHKTNIIRGILCHTCNLGLGMFKDNSILLENAIEYLKY